MVASLSGIGENMTDAEKIEILYKEVRRFRRDLKAVHDLQLLNVEKFCGMEDRLSEMRTFGHFPITYFISYVKKIDRYLRHNMPNYSTYSDPLDDDEPRIIKDC